MGEYSISTLAVPPNRRCAGAFGLVWYVSSIHRRVVHPEPVTRIQRTCSSAKDQLTGVSVAIKKIMKPFSTPVLAKRTYRELKLLKHITHENVRPSLRAYNCDLTCIHQIISLSDVFISPLEDL
jgi:serine/threonine protein kinase